MRKEWSGFHAAVFRNREYVLDKDVLLAMERLPSSLSDYLTMLNFFILSYLSFPLSLGRTVCPKPQVNSLGLVEVRRAL